MVHQFLLKTKSIQNIRLGVILFLTKIKSIGISNF